MAKYRTSRGTILGLGASHHGTGHFLKQRISALVLVFFIPFTLWQFLSAISEGYGGAIAWVSSWLGAGTLLVTVSFLFGHLKLGLQVVIEDYFGGATRKTLLLLVFAGCGLLWLISVLAVLTVFLGR